MTDKSRNSIWRGIFVMGFGTVLAQMINVLVQPILTRIVSAETLGIYTYIVSLATMVIPVASLKMDMLIVSEKDDEQAQYITDVSLILDVIVSVAVIPVRASLTPHAPQIPFPSTAFGIAV